MRAISFARSPPFTCLYSCFMLDIEVSHTDTASYSSPIVAVTGRSTLSVNTVILCQANGIVCSSGELAALSQRTMARLI